MPKPMDGTTSLATSILRLNNSRQAKCWSRTGNIITFGKIMDIANYNFGLSREKIGLIPPKLISHCSGKSEG